MTQLETYINSLPYIFYFLVVDEFLDIKLPHLNHFVSISPKSLGITLAQKNSGRLLSHPLCYEFIQQHTPQGFTPAIIPFKPSPRIDFICRQNSWLNVSNPSPINRLFEDKIKFAKVIDEYNIPHISQIITTFTQENYQAAQTKLGRELVLQTHFGWAGNSSFLSLNWADIATRIAPNTPVKISPYLHHGVSLINNCCLTPSGLVQSPPGLQFTGITPLTQNPLATVGRQWPSFSPPQINQQIYNLTQQFSSILQLHNYRGFFGLDFYVHQDRVYLLECNPRLTASFAFYTTLEHANLIEPLFYYHLLSFVPSTYTINIGQQNQRFTNQLIVGSELTAKNGSGTTTKKYQELKAFTHVCSSSDINQKYLDKLT